MCQHIGLTNSTRVPDCLPRVHRGYMRSVMTT